MIHSGAAALLVIALASPASAQRSPFRVDAARDLGLTLGAGAVLIGYGVARDELPGPHCFPCDKDKVNAFDRSVIGNRDPLAATVSDVLLTSLIALPFLATTVDVLTTQTDGRLEDLATESLILAETLAVSLLLNAIVKEAVRRPRPLAYDPQWPEDERQEHFATLSFYSGHSSTSFSMATAWSYLFTKRHPDSGWVAPVWIASHGLAASTAYLRARAGKHFWTDVLTGAAAGSAIGFLVPWLHEAVN